MNGVEKVLELIKLKSLYRAQNVGKNTKALRNLRKELAKELIKK